MPHRIAIAIAAHPDDIEFQMAGTLFLLRQAGFQTHYLTLASGNCGSLKYNAAATRSIRSAEARAAAKILDAQFHPSLTDDLEILYNLELLRELAALLRQIHPLIILTHSPQDYMEDHINTSRLAVTAAFARGMPNFKTIPTHPPIDREVTIYHAMPHGLRDQLRRRIVPDCFVDTSSVHKLKRKALACHKSQQPWLESSQGLDAYLLTMEAMSLEVGRLSRKFKHAEGWRRHLHLGFCSSEADPLRHALQKTYLLNPAAASLAVDGH
jgi:LmbE family N-acetylglucosaminyl deacetylase